LVLHGGGRVACPPGRQTARVPESISPARKTGPISCHTLCSQMIPLWNRGALCVSPANEASMLNTLGDADLAGTIHRCDSSAGGRGLEAFATWLQSARGGSLGSH
jgi:hypothetical protein